MTNEEINEEIDWLIDDNHMCLSIMNDEASDQADIHEARCRLASNRLRISELQTMKGAEK